MASQVLGKIGSRSVSRVVSSSKALFRVPSVSSNGVSLIQRQQIHTTPRFGSNKGPEGLPGQRHISPLVHVAVFMTILLTVLSYPSYMMYNIDGIRKPLPRGLSDETLEEINRRKELRAQGQLPVFEKSSEE